MKNIGQLDSVLWAMADLHRSKRSSAWGPGLKGPPKFIFYKNGKKFNLIGPLVNKGVYGAVVAPQSQLIGTLLDLNPSLSMGAAEEKHVFTDAYIFEMIKTIIK